MKFSMRRAGAVLGAVLVMVLALDGAAQAGPKDEKKAIQSFAAGRYDQALEIYAKLYADTLNPVYLRNIGRCHQKLKQPEKAIESFRDYLQKGKNISADEKAEIDGYIKEMEALRDEQARQQQPPAPVAPAPPGPVQPIPPGPAPGPGPSEAQPGYPAQPGYAAQPGVPPYPAPPPAGDQQPAGTLVAQPAPPQSQPVYTKWWFWTIVGAVVVGGVVTAVVLSSGTSKPPCPSNAVACGP
jgi:hypothetical protein